MGRVPLCDFAVWHWIRFETAFGSFVIGFGVGIGMDMDRERRMDCFVIRNGIAH